MVQLHGDRQGRVKSKTVMIVNKRANILKKIKNSIKIKK